MDLCHPPQWLIGPPEGKVLQIHVCPSVRLPVCVPVTSFPWNLFIVFSEIFRYRSRNWTLREKCLNTEIFLLRIFLYSDWIQENTDQKKLRIRKQWEKGNRNGLILVCLKRKAWVPFQFLHGDIHQGKVASETITFGGVCPGMSSHAQIGLNCL